MFLVMSAESMFATVGAVGGLRVDFIRARRLPHEFPGLPGSAAVEASDAELFETLSEFERNPACVLAQQKAFADGVSVAECRLRMLEGQSFEFSREGGGAVETYVREGGRYRDLDFRKSIAWRLCASIDSQAQSDHEGCFGGV